MSSGGRSPWWEEDPERLERELAELREIAPITEEAEDGGRLLLETKLRFGERSVAVEISFSADHPYVPPRLSSEPGLLERHQNPDDGHFCVVDNEEHWWRPHYTAAMMVEELQRLLDADVAGTVAEGELDIPEPVTGYLPHPDEEAVVVVDEAMLEERLTADRGSFELIEIGSDRHVIRRIEGVRQEDVTLSEALAVRLGARPANRRSRGRWEAIEPRPGANDIQQLWERGGTLLKEEAAPLARRAGRGRRNPKGQTVCAALTFMEEGPRRDEERRVWLFYEAELNRRGEIVVDTVRFVPTQALSQGVRRERTQELKGLEQCRAIVVGAGALGGHVIGELARAGVRRIDVIDPDVYDLNNSVRHVLPITEAGRGKAAAVAEWARGVNPFTEIVAHDWGLGMGAKSRERLPELVADTDVVIDTTGLHPVTRVAHRECSDAGKPLVSGALSVSGYGGRILVLRDSSPCFDCFLADSDIPEPEEGPREARTPYGCSHPAASCAGFDVLELAANVARTAVRAGAATGYPELDFDWAVINFRPGATRWRQGKLSPCSECPWCRWDA